MHKCDNCKKNSEYLYKYNGDKFWYAKEWVCENCYEDYYNQKFDFKNKEVINEPEAKTGDQSDLQPGLSCGQELFV